MGWMRKGKRDEEKGREGTERLGNVTLSMTLGLEQISEFVLTI